MINSEAANLEIDFLDKTLYSLKSITYALLVSINKGVFCSDIQETNTTQVQI